jgi:hypothetical protein
VTAGRFFELPPLGRLALFGCLLALVGGAAAAIGAASGLGGGAEPSGRADGMAMEAEHAATPADRALASGLSTAAGGFAFEPEQTAFPTGRSGFRFRIVDAGGASAHDFDVEGGVRLHLIVVRRDLSGYRHLHPRLQPDGSWLVPLTFGEPGAYRAFADFEAEGRKIVLGRDLFVAGDARVRPLPAPAPAVSADGYRVELGSPALRAGEETTLGFSVSRGGRPVDDFQPYVGMRGHLVALHDGDLAYSHVHPAADSAPGRIAFETAFPVAGTYRVFLQFKVAGRVVTAPFTLRVAR